MAGEAAWSDQTKRREEAREEKRMAVLRAAARLFTERGYDRTSLDDIAGALGVSKRTLYYYVKNKEDILSSCSDLAFKHLIEPTREASAAGAYSALERLQMFMRAYLTMISSDYGACMLAARSYPLSPAARAAVMKGIKDTDQVVRDLIREGIDEGSIAPCDPAITAAVIFGAFNWTMHWRPKDDEAWAEKAADQLLQPILDGLRPRRARASFDQIDSI